MRDYADGREARRGLQRYFEFYNQERLHQALDYRTPAGRCTRGWLEAGWVPRRARLLSKQWGAPHTTSNALPREVLIDLPRVFLNA